MLATLPRHPPSKRRTAPPFNLQEAKMLAALRHPNVLSFLGVCTAPPALVLEYCPRGSVFDTLQQARRSPELERELTWRVRLRMVSCRQALAASPALQVGAGMGTCAACRLVAHDSG
jgi:hypothetical protein